MVEGFADKETAIVWRGEVSRKLPAEIQNTARETMRFLNNVSKIEHLWSIPGLKAHKLQGKRKDVWSVRINAQWRLTFRWDVDREIATEVSIEDYH